MLHGISWLSFIKWIFLAAFLYYALIGPVLFRKEILELLRRRRKSMLLLPALMGCAAAQAQDGNQGILQANNMIRGYFDTGTQLLYAIGGVLALVGAIQVYRDWNDRQGQGHKSAAAWFGSCIFLVVVATVIRSFFGL